MTTLTSVAAGFAFVGVALGAFGAHGLRERIDPMSLEVYRTGVLYHLLHAVALLAVSLAAQRVRGVRIVGALFIVGIVLFSGSLYFLATTGMRWLGAVTPFGGMAFLVGWLVLAAGASHKRD